MRSIAYVPCIIYAEASICSYLLRNTFVCISTSSPTDVLMHSHVPCNINLLLPQSKRPRYSSASLPIFHNHFIPTPSRTHRKPTLSTAYPTCNLNSKTPFILDQHTPTPHTPSRTKEKANSVTGTLCTTTKSDTSY
jgi:hypothetical protein